MTSQGKERRMVILEQELLAAEAKKTEVTVATIRKVGLIAALRKRIERA